jgi:UDP-N-acetyl-D-galactosamine dehydrogenase
LADARCQAPGARRIQRPNPGAPPAARVGIDYKIAVDCHDPWTGRAEARHQYHLDCLPDLPLPGIYDAAILAVVHRDFVVMGAPRIRRWAKPNSILYDMKSVLPADAVEDRL